MAKLVANTYTHLGYIHSHVEMTNESKKIAALALFGDEVDITGSRRNDSALSAISRYLEDRERNHLLTTVDDVVLHFSGIPYGWMDRDVAGLLAVLLHDGQIKLSDLGGPLVSDDPKFAEKLLRPTDRKKVQIKLLREVPAEVQGRVRRIVQEYFEQVPMVSDSYESLAGFIRDQVIRRMAEPLQKIAERQAKMPPTQNVNYVYPGNALRRELQTFVTGLLAPTDPEVFVQGFLNAETDLNDSLDKIQDLENFYLKSPIVQFDTAVAFLEEHHRDWTFVADRQGIIGQKGQIEGILRSESPFGQISLLSRMISELNRNFESVLNEKRDYYRPRIEEAVSILSNISNMYPEHKDIQEIVVEERVTIDEFKRLMDKETQLSSVGSYAQAVEERISRTQRKIAELINVAPPDPHDDGKLDNVRKPRKETITTLSQLSARVLPHGQLRIESQEQIDSYLGMIKRELNQLLKDSVLIIQR